MTPKTASEVKKSRKASFIGIRGSKLLTLLAEKHGLESQVFVVLLTEPHPQIRTWSLGE